jgi:hypothetical protein
MLHQARITLKVAEEHVARLEKVLYQASVATKRLGTMKVHGAGRGVGIM